MARLTLGQERWRHIESILSPVAVTLIRTNRPKIPTRVWAETLGVSTKTIERIRSGERGATRKPMGGDRRSTEVRVR